MTTAWTDLARPGGLPALGLHCALGRGRDLRGLVASCDPPLALLAPDLPGHGGSDPWDGLGDYHDACTDAARPALDAPRVVIGHSLGATIALRLALEMPERVCALVLMEPVLFAAAHGTDAARAHAAFDARFAGRMAAGDRTGAAALFLDMWGVGVPFAALPDGDRARMADQMDLIAATAPALFDDRAALLRPGGLEGLASPVLLLRGADAPAVTAAINANLAARLPNAKMAEVPGAGHMAPLTHAAQVGTLVGAFLRALA